MARPGPLPFNHPLLRQLQVDRDALLAMRHTMLRLSGAAATGNRTLLLHDVYCASVLRLGDDALAIGKIILELTSAGEK